MSNKSKDLRGQLRQVVKDLLPELMKEAMFAELEKHIKARLDIIDERQKDISAYMVRHTNKRDVL